MVRAAGTPRTLGRPSAVERPRDMSNYAVPAKSSRSFARPVLRGLALLAVGAGGAGVCLQLLPSAGTAVAADPSTRPAALSPATAPADKAKKPKKDDKQKQADEVADAFFQKGTVPQVRIEIAK